MAETLISPGVLARENDQSQITQGPTEVGAAIIGPAVKGPVEVPTLVTSYSQYLGIFGGAVTSGSQQYSYLNQVAANNYFRQGGTSLLVTRVQSGSFTSAESQKLYNEVESGVLVDGSILGAITTNTADGDDSTYLNLSPTTDGDGTGLKLVLTIASNVVTAVAISSSVDAGERTAFAGTGYAVGDTLTIPTSTIGGSTDVILTLRDADIVNDQPFTISTISEGTIMNSTGSELAGGALENGSSDNIRWEILSSNADSGTFTLSVRRGDDVSNQKTVLETWTNLSLDPLAPNYIEAVIGNSYKSITTDPSTGESYLREFGNYTNKSNYIYVSAVNSPTPNYFNNNGIAKTEYQDLLPVVSSGSFASAIGDLFPGAAAKFNEGITAGNIQGISANDYTASIALLSNKDDYSFNVLVAPGLIHQLHPTQVNSLISTAEGRQDCLAIVDLRSYNSQVGNVVSAASGFDSSYAATYWPWLQTLDQETARTVWSPASVFIPGVFAYTDSSSDPWFAPAGLTRGGLGQVLKAERKLTSGNRDSLYEANINPIATFPQTGVVVFGQKTLQKKSSALDRVNVRRLLIALKSYITQVSDNLVFEQNTIATRNNFLSQVNPYLESVQQRQGLYAFQVVMDDTNNTPDVIDRNQLVGQIYLQPTKTAEYIILDFNVLPTGATFPA